MAAFGAAAVPVFWEQSPRSYVTIMEGAARAAKRKQDAEVVGAFNAAAFNGAAYAGKLDKMKRYLPKPSGPRRQQSGSDMLHIMREFAARGANMKITHKPN